MLRDPCWARLRSWAMVAGGPLVTASLLAAGMLFAEPDAGRELAPARMLQASNTVILVLALLPIPAPGHPVPVSDGLLLLFMWRMPKPGLSDLRVAEQHHACLTALRENRLADAETACAAALAEAPDDVALLNTKAMVDIHVGRFESARANLRLLLERPDLPPPLRPCLLNNLAWTAVMVDDGALLQEADEISREAVRKTPTPSCHGTRGAVLVLRGQPRRAIVHLRRSYERHEEDFGSAHAAAWLGAAEAALGHFAAANEWLAVAESLNPDCESLPRARRRLHRHRERREAKQRRAVTRAS